jgi:hypothetical protein
MRSAKAVILAFVIAWSGMAADTSWQNMASLRAGQKINVRANSGDLSGEFVRFDAAAVTIRDKKGEHTLTQADVSRVSLAKSSRGIWIGLVAGAVGGVVAGAALGTRLANESGGDFANLKGAVTGGCAAGGALIGMGIGAAVRHGRVIYQR